MYKGPAKKIFLTVLVLHISIALISKNTLPKKPLPNKVTVTYSTYSPPQILPKIKKAVQKTTQKKVIKKAPQKRIIKKKNHNTKALSSLEKAIKNLNFENSFQPKGESLEVPKTSIEFEIIKAEAYVKKETLNALIQTLQDHLVLPEHGSVKLKISFSREGKVISTEIISSKSKKNAAYLKNRLPELRFPCFNHCIKDETSLEFLFRNEQN